MTAKNIHEQLAAPFPSKDIDWRIGSTNREKTRGMALAYITARAVMDRLDSVFGIDGWYDHYSSGPSGGVLCSLSCRIDGEWVTKQDAADNSDIEAVKGGVSDALKRAAVKFGIGRYLYNLDSQWVEIEQRGNTSVMKSVPQLPDWALPEQERGQERAPRKKLADKVPDVIPGAKKVEAEPAVPSWYQPYITGIREAGIAKEQVAAFFGEKEFRGSLVAQWVEKFDGPEDAAVAALISNVRATQVEAA